MTYDPSIGRFLEMDPIGYDDGMNRYQMEHGNPLVFTDPSGLKAKFHRGRVINRSSKPVTLFGDWFEYGAGKTKFFPSTQAEVDWLIKNVPGISLKPLPAPGKPEGTDPFRAEVLEPGSDSFQFRSRVVDSPEPRDPKTGKLVADMMLGKRIDVGKLDPDHLILDVDLVLEDPSGSPELYSYNGGPKDGGCFKSRAPLLDPVKHFDAIAAGYKRGIKIISGQRAFVFDCGDALVVY